MRIFDKEALQLISLFELTTGVAPIDCVVKDKVYFVVNKKDIGQVLAKKGAKIKTLEHHINKKVVVFPYMETKEEFVKNVISENVRIKNSENSLKLFISPKDRRRVKMEAEAIKSFLNRLYNVKEVLFRW